jgi:alpha-D-xyloside xylohydrolase
MQTAAFSPLMMINAWYIKNPPWKQVKRDENNDCKFALDWQMLENKCREIIGWRMQLIPYLLSAFQRYATDGTPPFRALVLDYPFEQNVSAVDDAYLMGDRILVAPLFAGEAAREVKFPSGIWHDYWTGRVVKDGASISVSSATEKIPVFVKSGSVLPLSQVGLSSASMESKNLTVRIYGDGSLPWRIDSVDGPMLELSWNPVTQEGQIQQNAAATSKYHVVRWERMG